MHGHTNVELIKQPNPTWRKSTLLFIVAMARDLILSLQFCFFTGFQGAMLHQRFVLD